MNVIKLNRGTFLNLTKSMKKDTCDFAASSISCFRNLCCEEHCRGQFLERFKLNRKVENEERQRDVPKCGESISSGKQRIHFC